MVLLLAQLQHRGQKTSRHPQTLASHSYTVSCELMRTQVVPEYTHNITEPWAWPQAASADSSATAAAVGTDDVQGTARSIAVDSALGGSSSGPGLIGGAVGGALAALALLIAAVLVYFCIIRKNKRGSDLEPAVGDAVKGPDTDTHAATRTPGTRFTRMYLYGPERIRSFHTRLAKLSWTA